MRNWPCRFTAELCRSALRHWCLNPKEMKGLSTQGRGIDLVVSVFQHFVNLQRQGKRPEVHAKQKGIKNFITQLTIPLNKLPWSRSRSKAWDSPLIRRKSVPSPVSFHPKNRKRSSKTRSRSRSRSQSPVSRRPHRRIRGPPMDDSPILRRNDVPSPPSHKPKLPPMIRRTNTEPG